MATGEFKHLNRDERAQFYLATELGAAVHRVTSGNGEPRYDITRAADNSPIATGVSFEGLVAFTDGGQPLPPTVPTNPLDDLAAAVAALTTGFAELDAAVQAQLAVLTGALNGSGLPAPTLRPMQQWATNISFISSSMARDARAVMA